MSIAIIDVSLNNLNSVKAACDYFDLKTTLTDDPKEILKSDAIILPGVGSFGVAMKNLKKKGTDQAIKEFYGSGKNIFGICLGMQILFEKSGEFGKNNGLGLIKGEVIKFNKKDKIQYIPYIGWNEIKLTKNKSKVLESNLNLKFMYFVHSYYCKPLNNKIISATTKYGNLNYCSAISYQNIEAFQFHPEKSGKNGLNIYSKIKKIISK